jgi:hypothetical protein
MDPPPISEETRTLAFKMKQFQDALDLERQAREEEERQLLKAFEKAVLDDSYVIYDEKNNHVLVITHYNHDPIFNLDLIQKIFKDQNCRKDGSFPVVDMQNSYRRHSSPQKSVQFYVRFLPY